MTPASPLAFPGGRTLAGWWKQLAPLQPRTLWVGHLLLHRVEALAASNLVCKVDPLHLFVLRALALTGVASLQDLNACLHLGLPLLRQLVGQLEREKLVQTETVEVWSLTRLGKQGLDEGKYVRLDYARRPFYFVDNEQSAGPPHFLDVRNLPTLQSWPGVDGCRFEPGHLHACVGKSVEWKQRFGFPQDVRQIVESGTIPESAAPATEAWQRVILDRPERLVTALVFVPAGERQERLLGFAVQLEGWVLQTAEPAFVLNADWQEVLPELAADLSLEHWLQAWRTWCQPRGLPAAEVDTCILERQGSRLRVTAASRLVDRLRASRSDVFKGEAWVLAGTGRLRAAAELELVEIKRERAAQPTSGTV